jgi:multiple sugar transport system permease protein
MKPLKKALTWIVLIGLALFLLAPFVWMVLVSLHPQDAKIPEWSQLVPEKPAWGNYRFVLFHPDLPVSRFFLNTVIVSVCTVLGQLAVSSLAAYAFARTDFKGKNFLFSLFISAMMFAGAATQIPVYMMLKEFGWLNSFAALIVPGISSSFTIFLLRQFFMQIPAELDQAAKIDGANDWIIFTKIILPLSKAALATAGAFTFFAAWTDFFGPLIYTNTTDMRTLEVGLSVFKNSYGQTAWPLQMTAAVIVLLPLFVVFLIAQRYFTQGITMGSIK